MQKLEKVNDFILKISHVNTIKANCFFSLKALQFKVKQIRLEITNI